jgi:1,4-dihydroxy-2-naphthoate octaprenyltransferase
MLALAYPTALLPTILGSFNAWPLLVLLTIPIAVALIRTVASHTDGPTLNASLAKAGILELSFCVLLTVGLLLN